MPALLTKRKYFWLIGALAIVFIAVLIRIKTRSGDSELSTALPSPNGYDDFVAAENELEGALPVFENQPAAELSRIVTEHASVLQRTRQGLTRNCRLPLDYSPGALTNAYDHLAQAKILGSLLREEGHLAEMNSDYSKALQCYLATIQFASKRFRGGLIIHQLIRRAIVIPAEARLEGIIPKLNSENCRKAIASLADIEQAEEPVPQVLRRDFQWARRVSGMSHLQGMLIEVVSRKSKVASAAKLHEQQRSAKNLSLLLAARAFELDMGKRPKNVSDMVPKYLPNVPKDPATGADLNLPN